MTETIEKLIEQHRSECYAVALVGDTRTAFRHAKARDGIEALICRLFRERDERIAELETILRRLVSDPFALREVIHEAEQAVGQIDELVEDDDDRDD